MATQRYNRTIPKLAGPSGGEILTCDFTTSGTTADVTTNEAQGCTVARTGVGVFLVTTRKTWKTLTVGMSVQASTTAQLFIITAKTGSTITISQVTAGGGTAVDTLAGRVNLVIVGRANS